MKEQVARILGNMAHETKQCDHKDPALGLVIKQATLEVCQLFEPKPDESRLLTDSEFLDWCGSHIVKGCQTTRMMIDEGEEIREVLKCEDCRAKAQDAKTASIKDAEIAKLKNEVTALHRERQGEVWYWQGDGEDKIESLTCPILIEPEDFKAECQERVDGILRVVTEDIEAGLELAEREGYDYQSSYKRTLKYVQSLKEGVK